MDVIKMPRIIIDYVKCIAEEEKICIELCPAAVFQCEESGKPKVVNANKCNMCGVCQANCPVQAIMIST